MSCPAHDLAVSRRFLDWEAVDLIGELVHRLRPGPVTVVDVGAGSGTTALAVLVARPKRVKVYSIDHSEEALSSTGQAMKNAGFQRRWKGILSDSVEAARLSEIPTVVDLLLLDSSHEYEATREELAVWVPRLRKGGLLWLHDYRGGYPGVKRALDELLADGLVVEFGVRGLGWAGVRS